MVQKYVGGVAKKLKQIKAQSRNSQRCAPRLSAMQNKACLFCAVQYIASHAGGRARKVQAGNPKCSRRCGGTERDDDDQEYRRRAEAGQRQHGCDDEVVRHAVQGDPGDRHRSGRLFEEVLRGRHQGHGEAPRRQVDRKAIEIQTDYAKSAYEGFVAQATKIGELYADLAKETYKPFEAYVAKAAPSK